MENAHNDQYDGLPPLGFEVSHREPEIEHAVGVLSDFFARIAAGEDPAFNLSEALCCLQSETSRRTARIDGDQRDKLLRSITIVHIKILNLFPSSPEQALAKTALYATVGLICWWAETEEERGARHQHVLTDLRAYVRWLRNACHNMCLLQEIETRGNARRHETVAEIKRSAAA
ncbi:hypothetical protein [Agrobacterium fabrum]|uniref:hypothetical protein n=1 Tax=Agrobacterium fabrum TaxID=1176649 RepID=UPI003BA2953A